MRFLFVALTVAIAWFAEAAPALACTCIRASEGPAVFPRDDAGPIPTNAVFFVTPQAPLGGLVLCDAPRAVLCDDEMRAVEATVTHDEEGDCVLFPFVLRPKEELKPNATYRVYRGDVCPALAEDGAGEGAESGEGEVDWLLLGEYETAAGRDEVAPLFAPSVRSRFVNAQGMCFQIVEERIEVTNRPDPSLPSAALAYRVCVAEEDGGDEGGAGAETCFYQATGRFWADGADAPLELLSIGYRSGCSFPDAIDAPMPQRQWPESFTYTLSAVDAAGHVGPTSERFRGGRGESPNSLEDSWGYDGGCAATRGREGNGGAALMSALLVCGAAVLRRRRARAR